MKIDIAQFASDRICYILSPEGLKSEGKEWMQTAAEEFKGNIVIISDIDWNNDLTPWKAPGVFKKEKDFGGNADLFLKDLTNRLIPSIENEIGIENAHRYLVGISLSGLFAIWASTQTDKFSGIASISGSLWYNDFAQRFTEMTVNPAIRKFFLSLGVREKNSKDARMATVEVATSHIVETIKNNGFPVEYVIDEGTHFSPLIPRLQKALSSLMD